jgi:photosystem II stability/assembly factor-like uncharacterized protein
MRRSHCVALHALLLAALPVAAWPDGDATLSWRSIGPAVTGGRATAVAGTDADPALYYVGAAGGGVWKTTDGGQRWTPVFDDAGVGSVGAVTIDPSNEQSVWVGTGEANPRNDVSPGDGIYHTADGGKSWQRVLPLHNALVSTIAIDPRDPSRVLAAVLGDPFADDPDRGVYRTTDGGKTWTKTLYLGPQTGASDLALDPGAPSVVYAGMWQFRRTAWSLQSGGPQDGLYRSTDGGASWTRVTGNGFPTDTTGRIGLAFAPSNPRRIYAIVQSQQGLLWRSDDGGASWTMVSNDPLIDERPFYFNKVFVSTVDPDRVWSVSVHLTTSADGGKTFVTTGRGLHGDHHAMWIAADGRRMIEGNDGGAGFSYDGGTTWRWDNNIPISQLYHIGYSREHPYGVCVALQDNGAYCGPSDPLDPAGISSSQWKFVGSGDGAWSIFDPLDAHRVFSTFGGGNNGGDVWVHDFDTGQTQSIAPYPRDQNVVDPVKLGYRFNWETPIAFDPFDRSRILAGGNVLFASRDRGAHWTTISPDLTRHIAEHEVITGGVTLDGTGAETTDTILDIEPSTVARGQIWVGTDDGVIALTRDGGAHWSDVTPAGVPALGRFASISASTHDAATAYAIDDRHMVGDRRPYAFVTHDYGAHWNSIAAGLPAEVEARSILADPRNPHLIYLGTETHLWASWNDGGAWSIVAGLPPASIRDIRVQPDSDDLLIATHGRGAYVFDDASPLQQLETARAAEVYLFGVRPATGWMLNAYWNTPVDGQAPPYGAIFTLYLAHASKEKASAEIVDRTGQVVRHLDALDANAGLNRYVWDLASDEATPWRYAAPWNAGNDGVLVPPGTYTLRLHVAGHVETQPIVVAADPRVRNAAMTYPASFAFQRRLLDELSLIDTSLDRLSTIAAEAPRRVAALNGKNPALAAALSRNAQAARALIATISSNPANDQDNDFLQDMLRERVQSLLGMFGQSYAAPTAAQIQEAAVLAAATSERLAAVAAFERGLAQIDRELAALSLPKLEHETVAPQPYGQQGDDVERR